MTTDLLHSPLHDRHVALGAKLADFGGWEMPIEYAASGGGVIKEHTAVREAVGIFDVSHLGKATVRGSGARAFVNACLTNDLGRIEPGKAQYTLCCDDSGGVVDDLIAYLVERRRGVPRPECGEHDRGRPAARGGRSGRGRGREPASRLRRAGSAGTALGSAAGAAGLPADLDYMAYRDAEFEGRPVRICRTGYTGEHGYELIPGWADAGALWDALVAGAESLGGRPAGLGARDTLRTEAGYPLHGQDLSPSISPVQARSHVGGGLEEGRVLGTRRVASPSSENGPARLLWGLESLERGIPRAHMSVLDASGAPVGEVTSGTFSPTLKKGIALALIDTSAGVGAGDELAIDVRGKRSPVRVTKPPFVELHVR